MVVLTTWPRGTEPASVLRLADRDQVEIGLLLERYGLQLRLVAPPGEIPASYWGACEAGLRGSTLFARLDTPLHSVLHEASHFICQPPERRACLDRDAGGDDAEETAVCFLQILLAGELRGLARERMCRDMDEWGYSFRLGSARAWFEGDAEDARLWLVARGIVGPDGGLTGALRC
jgi:hypothetical protein